MTEPHKTTPAVARSVRAMYNAHPFPQRHIDSLAEHDQRFRTVLENFLHIPVQVLKNKTLLDAGCGTGENTWSCRRVLDPSTHMVAVDLSTASINLARSKGGSVSPQPMFAVNSLLDLGLAEHSVDAIYCSGVLVAVADPERAFRELSRVLKPGGYMVLVLYHRYGRALHSLRRAVIDLLEKEDVDRRARLGGELFGGAMRELAKKDQVPYEELLYDQFGLPCESVYSVGQALRWFKQANVQYLGTYPAIEWSQFGNALRFANTNPKRGAARLARLLCRAFAESTKCLTDRRTCLRGQPCKWFGRLISSSSLPFRAARNSSQRCAAPCHEQANRRQSLVIVGPVLDAKQGPPTRVPLADQRMACPVFHCVLGGMLWYYAPTLTTVEWHPNLGALGAAGGLYAVYLPLVAGAWGLILQELGATIPFREHLRIYCLTLVAGRIPGAPWHIAGRAVLYKAHGVGMAITGTAVALEMILVVVSGTITGLLIWPKLPQDTQMQLYWLAPVPVVCLALMHPALIRIVVDRFAHPEVPILVRYDRLLLLLLVYIVLWMMGGCVLYAVIVALYPLSLSELPWVIGAWSISGVAATIAFISPSSFGIKEIALSLLLTLFVPAGLVVIIAILVRLLLTGIEYLWAIAASRL